MCANYNFSNIIGVSDAIKELFALMEKAIDSDSDILITGETGTGKELVAKEIHYNSPRKERPLIVCNCSMGARDVLVNQLFGHRQGAFPEAIEDKMGLFESAEGSTLMLDEIDEMPMDVQYSLLRVLDERKIFRLGETTSCSIDTRVIAITNRELSKLAETGRFITELYTRLKRFEIHLPPLQERIEDIPLLAEHFRRQICRQISRDIDGFAPGVLEMFQRYPWPGNVRELRSQIRQACLLVQHDERVQMHHFSPQTNVGKFFRML